MTSRASATALIQRVGFAGVDAADTDQIRAQKAALTLAAVFITVMSTVWVGTYWALGLIAAAAIPFGYQVASIVTIIAFARSKSYRFFRFSQAAMMTLLPFLLQATLGGYVASSAVSLWGLVAAIGTLFFFTADESIPWFAAFLGLTFLSGALEPTLSGHASGISDPVRRAFFVLNVTGVSLTAYALLQYAIRARDDAFARSEGLLLNVLPRSIAERLKHAPGVIAEAYDEVTVLFADVVDFTQLTERTEPAQLVGVLDEIFSAFDTLAARHGLEKIKTIGDAYMVAAGLPEPMANHVEAMADMALEMQAVMRTLKTPIGQGLTIRIGMDTGPVIAGVIGRHKFIYDLWGDTVNTASRLESHGLPGRIQVSPAVYRRLSEKYTFEDRGEIELKGKGLRQAYLLVGRRPVERPPVA